LFFCCYHCRGEKLSPSRVNPLLRKFHDLLLGFKIEQGDFKAVVTIVDDVIIQEVDSRWIKVSAHLNFEIIDISAETQPLYGLDHGYSSLIHRELRKLSLTDGTYTKKVNIDVVDSYMGSSPPMNHEKSCWPKQRF